MPLPVPLDSSLRRRRLLAAAGGVLSLVIFGCDLLLPLGVAAGVPYVAPVLLAQFSHDVRDVLLAALLGSVLTVAGYALSPAPVTEVTWAVLANRGLALFAIWSTAGAVWLYHRSRAEVERVSAELARSEAERARRESLARIGEMTSTIAHEVKNPLAGLRGALQVIGARLPHDADRKVIDTMCARIDRLHSSLVDMLAFGRPPMLAPARTTMRALINEAVRMLAQDPQGQSAIVTVEGEDCWVELDKTLIGGALFNIVLNAAQAAPEGARIHIEITPGDDDVRIDITDEGPGIDPDMLARVCEPFFTTKVRGSGLGLAIVTQTVEQHGGTVSVTAPEGEGTRVRIDLPRTVSAL